MNFKKISGESNSVTPEMVNAWKETSLTALLPSYDLKDIYNADEFGVLYKCMTSKSCQLKSEKCLGGKLRKVLITGMTAEKCCWEQDTNVCGWKSPKTTLL